jgi:MFS family permease
LLIRLGLALFLAQSAFMIYGATLPLYFHALGFDATLIGLLVGVTGVAELVGALAVGPTIDRFGGRPLLLGGVACYVVSSLAYTQLTSVPALVVLRLLAITTVPAPQPGRRPLGLTFRRAWLMPLLVAILSVVQWGVIQAFVPIEASAAGANPALLFTADAICVLASRVPAGWIADRYGPLRLALIGVVSMALSPCVLLFPLSNGVLVAAGILNGTGAGLTLPPMMAQLSLRSDQSTRGSALAYFSVGFAVGMIVGASGGGLLYPLLGFRGLLGVGAALCAGGVGILLADMRALRLGIPVPST